MIVVGGNLNPHFAAVATRPIADRNVASDISPRIDLRNVRQVSIMEMGLTMAKAQKLNTSKIRSQFFM